MNHKVIHGAKLPYIFVHYMNKLSCITHVWDIGIKVIFMKIRYLAFLHYML